MKLLSVLTLLALAAAAFLYVQNQNLDDRFKSLEERVDIVERSQTTTPTASSFDKEATRRMNGLSICLAQLHAQVVSLWNAGELPPDGPHCRKRFYGLGPRVGD
ncbi:MAG: hypothetical protein ACRDJS_07475 [Actinomycetota bacterium]